MSEGKIREVLTVTISAYNGGVLLKTLAIEDPDHDTEKGERAYIILDFYSWSPLRRPQKIICDAGGTWRICEYDLTCRVELVSKTVSVVVDEPDPNDVPPELYRFGFYEKPRR